MPTKPRIAARRRRRAGQPLSRSARFSPDAQQDLREALRWLRRENPDAAIRLRAAVLTAAKLLGEQPRIAPERPELASPPLRILVVRGFPYILAYDAPLTGPTVILRVLHSSRDIPSLLTSLVRPPDMSQET